MMEEEDHYAPSFFGEIGRIRKQQQGGRALSCDGVKSLSSPGGDARGAGKPRSPGQEALATADVLAVQRGSWSTR